MLKLALLEYKKKQRLFSLMCGLLFTVFMYLSQCRVDDRMVLAKPLDQKQFLYSLLIDDYNNNKIVKHPHLESFYINAGLLQTEEILTPFANRELGKLLEYMNPDYSKKPQNVYDIDFSHINDEQLVIYMNNYSNLLNSNAVRYYPPNLSELYRTYARSSAFFSLKEDSIDEQIVGKTAQTLLYAVDNGYMKCNILFGYSVECNEEEKAYLKNKAEELMLSEYTDIVEMSNKCNSVLSEIDEHFGGNTSFSPERNIAVIPQSYEEAIRCYEEVETKEGTGFALARHTSDYLGICAGIMPVFLSAFSMGIGNKKRRELVFPRSIDSYKFVLLEGLSVFVPYSFFFFILYAVDDFNYISLIREAGGNPQYFAYPFYYIFWIVPTLMVATILPMFLFEVVRNEFIAAILSVLIMFISMAGRSNTIFQPIIRFNSFGKTTEFMEMLPRLILNREIMIFGSIALIVASILLHERWRTHSV